MKASSRPALRPVETIVVPDARHGRVVVLRDTQGVTDAQAVLPPALVPVIARFDGQATCEAIARGLSRELGEEIPVEVVVRLAEQLDQALLLDSPRFREAQAAVEAAFADADVRPATHAGGAYPGEAAELTEYIERRCLGLLRPPKRSTLAGKAVALIAPHIDPWRGALGYGHAYAALAATLPEAADTFVLLGTSHAPMREPFALCRKAFATPLGDLPPDEAAIDALAAAAPFDPYADAFNHKREHSLEFQAVFLRHLLAARGGPPAGIVPVLCGLGRHQAAQTDPAGDPTAMAFVDGLRALVAARPGRVVLIAGADLAHVGPRFGDRTALGPKGRKDLEATDRRSLGLALTEGAGAFWEHVVADLDTRRVCGLAPVYTLLRTLEAAGPTAGRLLHYEQTVDPDEGSIVSHAALAFTA